MLLSNLVNRQTPRGGSKGVKKDPSRPIPDCVVGVEIELEGVTADPSKFTLWNIVPDGSLRDGIELVSIPVWGTDISLALKEVESYFKSNKPYLSFRTSVHVHINILDLTNEQLNKFIQLYILYEPALFRMHLEWDRYDNIFCIPARKSYSIQEGYATLFKDLKENSIRGNYVGYKYSSMNPNSIATLGTLEFRHMGGTDSVKKIDTWINTLMCLKKSAMSETDVCDYGTVFGSFIGDLQIEPSDIKEGLNIIEHINIINGD